MGRAISRAVFVAATLVLGSCGADTRTTAGGNESSHPATTWRRDPPATIDRPPPTTRPTPTTVSYPPYISLDCGPPEAGGWDWYDRSYGYEFNSTAPIVELGVDYGDGANYVTGDAADAEANAFWHRYDSPGSYQVQAWIVDANGLRDTASCVFSWQDTGGDWTYNGGDLDCADIGYEHYITDDPYGLDADNDGIACEGW